MTFLEVSFHYERPPRERAMMALNDLRQVYGIWRLSLDEKNRSVTVQYDATRLTESEVAALLRNADFDLRETPAAA